MRRAIASVLQAFAVFLLFATGFFLTLLRYLPEARMQVAHRFFHEPDLLLFVGVGFFLAAFLFGFGFYAVNRGRYLQIQMGTEADMDLLHKMLAECLKMHFSKQIALEGVECEDGNKLEIAVKLAPLAEADREALLRSAEQQLKQLLREKLGYINPFYLTVRIR